MPSDSLDFTFATFADPTRRAMLARLASGEATVKELTEPFDMTPAAIAKHLKVLERPGLISSRQVAVYLEEYRGFWEAGFQCLDAYL